MLLKEKILQTVSEEEVFRKYLKIDFKLKKSFRSPLREDKTASANIFKTENGRLYFKDFATGNSFDCFGLVMRLFNVNFVEAIKIVAHDFNIENDEKTNFKFNRMEAKKAIKLNFPLKRKERTEIPMTERDFTNIDLKFWSDVGVTEKTLNLFDCFAIDRFMYGDYYFQFKEKEEMAYVYLHKNKGKKMYFPNREKGKKFMSNINVTDVFGIKILESLKKENKQNNYIFICAGEKDTMALYSLLIQEFPNIACICFNSESTSVSLDFYLLLREYSDNIFVIYDNDATGKNEMSKMNKSFSHIEPIDISKITGLNDVSEYMKEFLKSKNRNTISSNQLLTLVKEKITLKTKNNYGQN